MLKKISIFCLLFCFYSIIYGNMASPWIPGSTICSAYSSKNMDILQERIHIKIDPHFSTAIYTVEYTIRTVQEGKQIPLLFYAKDYSEQFKVWVDNQEIVWSELSGGYSQKIPNPMAPFGHIFSSVERDSAYVYWKEKDAYAYPVHDLKYFETDLSKGTHVIRVQYIADAWINRSNWVKEYDFRYSLAPAKYWKSFGTLEVSVETSDVSADMHSNIGEPTLTNPMTWKFSKLPDTDMLSFSYTPKTNFLSTLFIAYGPMGMAYTLAFLLAFLHLYFIYTHQKNGKKYVSLMVIGDLIVPAAFLLMYITAYPFIDYLIGETASLYHGYASLAIFLYPFILPIYALVIWLISFLVFKNILKKLKK